MTLEIQNVQDGIFRFILKCDFCYSTIFARLMKEMKDVPIAIQEAGDYNHVNGICDDCKNKIVAKVLEL